MQGSQSPCQRRHGMCPASIEAPAGGGSGKGTAGMGREREERGDEGRCTAMRAQRAIGRMLAGAALALCGACAGTSELRPQLSESAVRLEMPLVRQDALYDCGLAALSALCQRWGVAMPAEQRDALAREADEKAGLTGDDLGAALDALGLEAFLFEGALDRSPIGLYRHLDAGRPLLVMLSPDARRNHYALVLGYDEPHDTLVVFDPRMGEVVVPRASFARDWERCGRFTLLVAGPRAAEGAPAASGATDAGASPNTRSERNPR